MNTFNFQAWWANNGSRFNEPAAAKQAATDLLFAALESNETVFPPPYNEEQVDANFAEAARKCGETIESICQTVRSGRVFLPK